ARCFIHPCHFGDFHEREFFRLAGQGFKNKKGPLQCAHFTLSLSKVVRTLLRQLVLVLLTDQSQCWTWPLDHLISFTVRNDITWCEISETPIYCQERMIIQIWKEQLFGGLRRT